MAIGLVSRIGSALQDESAGRAAVVVKLLHFSKLSTMRFSVFQTIFFLLASTTMGVAQSPTEQSSPMAAGPCTAELFAQAETSFESRVWSSEKLGAAERLLTEVVRLCEDYPAGFQAREQLKTVNEELGRRG